MWKPFVEDFNEDQIYRMLVATGRAEPTEEIKKAAGFSQPTTSSSGLQNYNLQLPAKNLYPMLTPLRNRIPRVGGGSNIGPEWMAVTAIATGYYPGGIPEGARGINMEQVVQRYSARYHTIGADNFVTVQADLAAQGADDLKARASLGTLKWLMIQEEGCIIGGRSTGNGLGTTPTPTLAAVTGGGALTTATLSVICVALGFDAYWALGGWNNGFYGSSALVSSMTIPGTVNKTTADGTAFSYGGGAAKKSNAATVSVSNNDAATAVVAAVNGAVAYAWFWGVAGSETLGAVTASPTVKILAAATGTQLASALPASDTSTNDYVFDGMLTLLSTSGSGAVIKQMTVATPGVGPTLTSNGGNGIVEIDAMLVQMYNNTRTQPDEIFLNVQQAIDINNKVLAAGGHPLIQLIVDMSQPDALARLAAGGVYGAYVSPVTGKIIKLTTHPNMPAGTIMFWTDSLPYDLNNVPNLVQISCRRDYWQQEWPQKTNKYEYGTYADETLQNYFPPAFGLLQGISPG